MSKKGTSFCPAADIDDFADRIFTHLRHRNLCIGLPFEEFVEEITDFYISVNYLHPFREGNGRTQRVFLTQLIRNAGYDINFSEIDTDLLMIATIKATHGITDLLKTIFSEAIKQG